MNHVYQLLCSRDSVSEYSEVNDLYRKIFNSFREFRYIDRRIYMKFHDKYCLERNASLNAANFLVEVFDQTELDFFSKLSQINYLIQNGYYLRRRKLVSPVERTFKYLRIKDKVEEIDLPFKVLFEHGFKITDEDFHLIYDDLLDSNGRVGYYKALNRVKTLIKRDEDRKNLSK